LLGWALERVGWETARYSGSASR